MIRCIAILGVRCVRIVGGNSLVREQDLWGLGASGQGSVVVAIGHWLCLNLSCKKLVKYSRPDLGVLMAAFSTSGTVVPFLIGM